MGEEKKDQWINYLAFTTVILAVSATLSTFRGANYSTQSVINEIKASNQWSFFQAKRIREYMFEVQKDVLESQVKLMGPAAPAHVVADLEKKLSAYDGKIREWKEERAQIERDARGFEKTRDEARRHSKAFGFAVIFLQMAILLSSIATLVKKKAVWGVGVALGGVGLIYFADGFLLFFAD